MRTQDMDDTPPTTKSRRSATPTNNTANITELIVHGDPSQDTQSNEQTGFSFIEPKYPEPTPAAAVVKYPVAFQIPPEVMDDGNLKLRRIAISDSSELHTAINSSLAEIGRYMPWAANGYSESDAAQYVQFCNKSWENGWRDDDCGDMNYAILQDGRIYGGCGLMRQKGEPGLEIGYWLANSGTGRGLATRAATMLIRAAFDIGAEWVEIRHRESNIRSKAIPQRLGFTYAGSIPAGDQKAKFLDEPFFKWRIYKNANSEQTH